MTIPQRMAVGELMKTARLVVAILSFVGGGTWAARGLIDGYIGALDANTLAIQGAVQQIGALRSDLDLFKNDVAKQIGRLEGAQRMQERQSQPRVLDAAPVPVVPHVGAGTAG
jgi:hypothetical protein